MYKNVLIVVATVAVLTAVSFLCTCSKGGRSSITGAATSLGGVQGNTYPVVSPPSGSDSTRAGDAEHPRVDSLNHADGASLETESGVFTLFVVDKYNRPDRAAAGMFEMTYDSAARTLNVGADLCVCPPESETREGADAHEKEGAHAGAPLQDSLYFVLYYDNTRLTPTGSEYGGILGASSDVLTLAMMNEPGHLEYAIARLNLNVGAACRRPIIEDGRPQDAAANETDGCKQDGRRHAAPTAFSITFSPSPFFASRSTSTVEERRRNMAPIDFVPQDNVDGSFSLEWTERNVGDYDGSGEVGVPDITPIAQNYLKRIDDATTPLERELYEQIDGDKSGDIGVADITPIANNYLNRVEGYDLWRAGSAQPTSVWLPNIENPGLYNEDTASAPRPDDAPQPPARDGLAVQYSYASSASQTSAVRGGSRTISANQRYFYTITPHEDGQDLMPPGVTISTDFSPTFLGSPELHLSVEISGTIVGPFMLAVLWDKGMRPQVIDNYKADGTDNVITHTYPGGGQYHPSMTIIAANGFAFAKSLKEVNVKGPQASLIASPKTGDAPLSVFFDASNSQPGDAPIARYEWDWEGDEIYDEDTGLNSTVNHVYSEEGTYNATVRVWDEEGVSGTASETISVNESAIANLTADPTSGNPPLIVTFDAGGSTSPNGAIVNYEWDWEGDAVYDNTSGSVASVQHAYEESGTFNATVRITDAIGAQSTDSVTIQVNNNPPVVEITADITSGTAPLTVNFDASGSSDPDGTIIRFEWDLDGDGTFEKNTGIVESTSYEYTVGRDYAVQVKATDNEDATAIDTVDIQVNAPPSADANAVPTNGNQPLTVNFNASGTSDADGMITKYEWDFENDGIYDWESPLLGTTSNVYEDDGSYTAVLRVTDDKAATSADSVQITVTNTPPAADLSATPTEGAPPLLVNLDASNSNDPDGNITDYEWDFDGDGTYNETDNGESEARDNTAPSHEYTYAGDYVATVRVTDEDGATNVDGISIRIYRWNIEIVDSAGLATSIALDSNDHPHISYYNYISEVVEYAYYNGTEWMISTVDGVGSWNGYSTSITLDSNERPHIGYFEGTLQDLKYAYFNGSSWVKATIDSIEAGNNTSIALDSNDRPHISYVGQTYVKYAYFNGSSWDIETVDSNPDILSDTSIALSSNDRPHISYRGGGAYLTYAYYNGSSWVIATVDNQDWIGEGTSIALSSNDRPHISYRGGGNEDLRYAKWNGSLWVMETVDSAGNVGSYSSIALDSNDRPHISYTGDGLKYAYYDGSQWNIETVDNTGGLFTSIALDSKDLPHISHWDGNNGDLKYAWFG